MLLKVKAKSYFSILVCLLALEAKNGAALANHMKRKGIVESAIKMSRG
jgi:hypothetical protein